MAAPTTTDTFFDGRLHVVQGKDGYRYSLDAILLAAAIHPRSGDTLVDLGTGCAIIPLILAHRHPEIDIRAVELQEELVTLAKTNVSANGVKDRIRIVHADARRVEVGAVDGPVDWVISNPPFYPAGSGRINPNDQKAMARHELVLTLDDLLVAVRRLLRTGGQFATIYPGERAATLLRQMSAMGIEPKWMRTVHSHALAEAKLVLVKGVMAGKPGLKIDRPLVIYRSEDHYSDEVEAMMEP